jgi:serine/threonine protein kinase
MTGGYQLQQWIFVEQLGEGGMAEVWKARHVHIDEFAAIKFLLPQYAANPEVQERFLQEGRSQFQLRHPNIIKSSDFITQENHNFLVMEYIEGSSLEDLLLDGALPLERVLELALPLLDALGHAHEKYIVHRDVKPSNVLLDVDGKPYLTDFGIAKALQPAGKGSGRSMTSATAMMGSVHYMSPEQIKRPADVDARSDIYSFGCVLYEMLTGQPPFDSDDADGTDFEIIRQQVEDAPRPLRELNPAVPAHLEAAVLCALSKDRSRRFASCKAMARALREGTQSDSEEDPTPRRRFDTVVEVVADDAKEGSEANTADDKKRRRTETVVDTNLRDQQPPRPAPEPRPSKRWFRAAALLFVAALLGAAVYLAVHPEPKVVVVTQAPPVDPPPAVPGDPPPVVDPASGSGGDPDVTPGPGGGPPVNPPPAGPDEAVLAPIRDSLRQMQGADGGLQQLRQGLEAELRSQQRNASQLADQLRADEAGLRDIEAAAARLERDLDAAQRSSQQSGQAAVLERQAAQARQTLGNLKNQEARWAGQLSAQEASVKNQSTDAAQLAERLGQAEAEQRSRVNEAARLTGLLAGAGGGTAEQVSAQQIGLRYSQDADGLRGLAMEAMQLTQRPGEAAAASAQQQRAAAQLEAAAKALERAGTVTPPPPPPPLPHGSFRWRLSLRQGQTALIRFKPDGQREYDDGVFLDGQGFPGVQADLRVSSDAFEVSQPLLPSTGFRQVELKCRKRQCNEVVTVSWSRN